MGGCFSSVSGCCVGSQTSPPPPTAKIISIDGHLHQFTVPVVVSRVLQTEISSSSSSADCFLSSSDSLYYDEYVPALGLEDQLQANQIYFVLPKSKLRQRLTASEMAALAVKASVALQNASANNLIHTRRKKAGRISPLLLHASPTLNNSDDIFNYWEKNTISENRVGAGPPSSYKKIKMLERPAIALQASQLGVSRSGSVKKLQRFNSRGARTGVRSFRLRLTTIYESTVLPQN